MGESTCLMHSFSFTSGISNDTQEGSPMYGYGGDSVSFGRFMEEPLSWEKWSTFSRNRYVDEAKSYSKPGSVAQKKAYFEAHFKRMAALKAAALLEQQMKNNTNTDVNYTNLSIQQQGSSGGGIQAAAALLEKQLKNGSTDVVSTEQGSGNEAVVATATATPAPQVEVYDNSCSEDVYHDASEVLLTQKSSLSVEAEGNDLVVGVDVGDDIAHESCLSSKPKPDALEKVNEFESGNLGLPANHEHDKSSSNDDAGENHSTVRIDEEEKDLYSVKFERTSVVNVLDSKKRNSGTDLDWGIAKADNILMQPQKPSSSNQEVVVDTTPTPSVTKSKKNPPLSSFIPAVEIGSYASPSTSPPRSVRQQVTHPGKENLATPTSGKKSSSWLHHNHHETTDSKKRTPLRMTINREFNRFISPVIKKIGSSSKPKSYVDGAVDYPSEIPQSGRRRARALFDSSPANGSNAQAVGPMGQTTIPSADGSKSPTNSRNKTGAPVMSAFCLRRRDKSAQKRMENLDENERQQPSKSKGKKASEINKLRHSFCFGARLSSESFRERDRDRSLRTSAIDNSTHEAETLQNGTAGSSLHLQKSSRKTSHHKKTPKHHSSTSS